MVHVSISWDSYSGNLANWRGTLRGGRACFPCMSHWGHRCFVRVFGRFLATLSGLLTIKMFSLRVSSYHFERVHLWRGQGWVEEACPAQLALENIMMTCVVAGLDLTCPKAKGHGKDSPQPQDAGLCPMWIL